MTTQVSITVPQILTDTLTRILPQAYVEWWVRLMHDNPTHLYIETTLILVIIYILFKTPKTETKRRHAVTEDVVSERLAAFTPEPLAPAKLSEEARLVLDNMVVIESAPSAPIVKVEGKNVVNFASADFLDYGSSAEVRKATEDALDKYGVGSCGPRGFYGTIDAHVKVEEAIASFFSKPEAIIYSDGASTICSAVPAFANRSDLLVVDEGCNDNVFTGVRLSRAKVIKFKHNDMDDLERVMKQVDAEDAKMARKADENRRFVIVEGLYRNMGDIVPLPRLYELKMKYKWRIICDETLSFGVLGKTGKGVTEHFSNELKESADDVIEIMIGSLETTLASVGGFCVGSQEVVEHQRLNGAGYCFSASAPPFTCTAAHAALNLLADKEKGQVKLEQLKQKAIKLVSMMSSSTLFQVISHKESPVVHLKLKKPFVSHMEEVKALRNISQRLLHEDKMLVIPTYYPDAASPPPNTLRMYLHVTHSEEDLKRVCDALNKQAKAVVG